MWKGLSFQNLGSFRFDLRPESARSEEPSTPPKIRTVIFRDINVRAELLSCALIDILRFVYEITDEDFSVVMAKAEPALYKRAVIGVTRLLKLQEQDDIMEIADAVTEACLRVANNHQSLITMSDRTYIVTNVIEPARYLRIEPKYVIEQLQNLSVHRLHSANLKKTLLYTNTVSGWGRGRGFLPSGWLADKKAMLLAKRLVSDDITVANLNALIGDALCTMLGTAIADFGKQHCRIHTGSVEREIYADANPAALAREAQHWGVMARREKSEKAYASMPVSRKPCALDDVPPVPPLASVMPGGRGHPLSTLPEPDMGPTLETWRAETNRITRGVRADDEQPDSLVVEYHPDVEAPAQPYPGRSQSMMGHRPRTAAKVQRSASMNLKAVYEVGRGW